MMTGAGSLLVAKMLTRQFLTVREVADLLQIGEVTVRHWIKGNELRAFDVGREWRIAPADLEFFLQRHATLPQDTKGVPQDGAAAKSPVGAGQSLPEDED